jgi:hypothetical protein
MDTDCIAGPIIITIDDPGEAWPNCSDDYPFY